MKKIILTLAFAVTAALTAQAQPVYSNAVGMVKLTLERGKTSIVHNPMDSSSGSNYTVSDIFGNSMPDGTTVYFWKVDQNGYDIATFGRGSWDGGNIEVSRGKAMFVTIPANAANASYELVLNGNVPDNLTASTTNLALNPGLTLTAFPYPATVKVVDADIPAQDGDVIFFWTGTVWEIVTYGRGAWDSNTAQFEPGKGFFYLSSNLNIRNWIANIPYILN